MWDIIVYAPLRHFARWMDEEDQEGFWFGYIGACGFTEGYAEERNRIPISDTGDLVLYHITHPANIMEIAVFERRSEKSTPPLVVDFTTPLRVNWESRTFFQTRPSMNIYSYERDILRSRIKCEFKENVGRRLI